MIDTGVDLTAPDIGVESPVTYSVISNTRDVRDGVGHGTFVSALAAGSDTNGDGMAGFGGRAKLMVIQASRTLKSFTDVDEATGIVWAVDHGARILNLSLGGPDTSTIERSAIAYAAKKGALVVTAVGNGGDGANEVEYPAALVQPVGSNGRGGTGLSVGASDETGARSSFSDTGSHLSLLAPGTSVLSATSSTAPDAGYVAGIAALVWAANPHLTAKQVAHILKQSASNHGAWNQDTGYGLIDAAAAVQAAQRLVATRAVTAPAAAGLTLTASAVQGTAPLDLGMQASLTSAGRPATGRTIALEAYDGGA